MTTTREDSNNAQQPERTTGGFQLSAPWGDGSGGFASNTGNIGSFRDDHSMVEFLKERSKLHSEYIRQTEYTKRLTLIIGCLCILSACLIVTFAPNGKETVSYVFAAVMAIVAAGAFGFGRVWAKSKLIDIGADNDLPRGNARGGKPARDTKNH
jgi:hypothetical protein